MSLSSETPSLLSAEAHLRMLVHDLYTCTNANIEAMPAATQTQRIIREPLPIPEELFPDAPPPFLPIELEPDTIKQITHHIVVAQTVSPDEEVTVIREAQAALTEQASECVPAVGALVLVNVVDYTTRNTTTKPPSHRAAGRIITQTHLTIVRDVVNLDDAEYRVFSRTVRQTSPALGSPEPLEELARIAPCFNDQLIPINQYLIDAIVDTNSKSIEALTPENFA